MLNNKITEGQNKVQKYLTDYFKNIQIQNNYYGQIRLCDAMQYSVLNGGKRFRALLVYWVGEAIGLNAEILHPIAASLEIIHAFSLIHDDLPAMDDDELRRSLPTCHIKFDEATAILAGDALCSEAFKVLTSIKNIKNNNINSINILNSIEYFAEAIGPKGMVAGQSMDVNNKDILDQKSLDCLHNLKTGKLIQASILLPLILKGIKQNDQFFIHMQEYAQILGVAFQIKDDLLDKTGCSKKTGKKTKKDKDMNKATYPEIIGMEKCIITLNNYTKNAINRIDKAEKITKNQNLENLKDLVQWNLDREK
tara:strand:- start:4242 stop:5168 length:927 start_codon:yes stop_codon:yes gene_type:complete